MNDPLRLREGDGSAFERELLGSLGDERPPPALSRRMRQGLVVAGVLASAKTGVASFLVVAGLMSMGAGGGWLLMRQRAEKPLAPVASAKPTPSLTARATAAPPALPVPSAVVNATPELAPSAGVRPSVPALGGDLREEIALLDRARSALRSGNGGAALAELAQYSRRFPRGEFSQEVTALRIEALSQSGQAGAARALGKKFLAAHPESPHAERIERLLGTAP